MAFFREKRPKTGAVVVAAGKASRMGGVNKQMISLEGVPVIARCLTAFERCTVIDRVVVVARQEMMTQLLRLTEEYGLSKVSDIVAGGESRQQSVFSGIQVLGDSVDYYVIHDGARPFLSPAILENCVRDAHEHRAATAAVRMKDTVKEAGEEGYIQRTIPRELLYLTQTPQAFEAALYRQAMELARAEGMDYTDDCQLVERLGQKIYLSKGDPLNFKITTPEDQLLAEAVAARIYGRDS